MAADATTLDETNDPGSDLELARGVLEGREAAIERFIRRMRCVPRILSAQNDRMGKPLNEHDLADLAQDTVIVVWKKLDQFAGRSSLEGWVYRVCTLEFMNSLRRKRRLPGLVADASCEPEDKGNNPETRLDDYEDLYRALDRLEPEEAEMVRLKHFDELTFQQMGRRVGISPNTAKTRYYRALSRLHTLLGSVSKDG